MAVTITVAEVAAAIRVGNTAEETAQVTRLLAYATEAVTKHAPDAPDVIQNEAVILLVGYHYDKPTVSGSAGARGFRNSGAASLLLPYRVHRAGNVSASEAPGTSSSPGGPGVDQTARDAAEKAQGTADSALEKANANAKSISGLSPGAAINKATNADIDGETEDSRYTTTAKVFRAISRKVKNATATVRGIVLLARNEDVDLTETDLDRVPTVSKVIRLWNRLALGLNQVPSTPGTSTGIGEILTVYGENDKDYRWEKPPRALHFLTASDLFQTSASPNSITFRNAPAFAYGQRYGFFAEQTNTGPVTVHNGLDSEQILNPEGRLYQSGELKKGRFYEVVSTGSALIVTAEPQVVDTEGIQNSIDGKLSRGDLPPFATIEMVPGGIPGIDFPSPFDIIFSERLTAKTISKVDVTVNGVGTPNVTLDTATTPLNLITGAANRAAALRFSITSDGLDLIKSNLTANSTSLLVAITFTFTDGTKYIHTISFPVNNNVFARGGASSYTPPSWTLIATEATEPDNRLIFQLTDAEENSLIKFLTNGKPGRALLIEATRGNPASGGKEFVQGRVEILQDLAASISVQKYMFSFAGESTIIEPSVGTGDGILLATLQVTRNASDGAHSVFLITDASTDGFTTGTEVRIYGIGG